MSTCKRLLLRMTVPRIRMGCHGLPRDSGSWAGIPRADVVCSLCGVGSVGDEKHLVFECPHLQSIRDTFQALFTVSITIQ